MEWRIRETNHLRHGFYAEYGQHIGGTLAEFKPGYVMPAFIISEKYFYDTKEQAEKYVKSRL